MGVVSREVYMGVISMLITFLLLFSSCAERPDESAIKRDFRLLSMEKAGTLTLEPGASYRCHKSYVYSLNRNTFILKKYSVTGEGAWRLEDEITIPKGKGPGESVQPADFTLDRDGKLLLIDSEMNRIDIYDSNLEFLDTVPLDLKGTLLEGDGMIAAYGKGKAAISQVCLERAGYEMSLADYDNGGIVREFGRQVEIDLSNMKTFVAATGRIQATGNTLYRLTYEPMLYLYRETTLKKKIGLDELLDEYNIRLVMPGVRSRNKKKEEKGPRGISQYALLKGRTAGTVCLLIKDFQRNRLLCLEFDDQGTVIDRWQISSPEISEERMTSLFLYAGEYLALYGRGVDEAILYHIR